ncbi:MAG: hypothetical protein ACRBI6_04485 [Acidimicrobiales bacterium]
MTVVVQTATAATFQQLRDRVRRWAGDKNATSFDDPDVDAALNHAMAEVHRAMGLDPAGMLATTDVAFTASDEWVSLDETLAQAAIYMVQDVTHSRPEKLTYVTPAELESYREDRDDVQLTDGRRSMHLRWSLRNREMGIRPRLARTIRVSYIVAPSTVSGAPADDQHPYPVEQEEFIEIAAAHRLLRIDDEVPISRVQEEARLRNEMIVWARRRRGRINIQNVRRFTF